jgi:asparagine synthase (glutamine-hydrolysing)
MTEGWLVIADTPGQLRAIAGRDGYAPPVVAAHASGRPFLVGAVDPAGLTVAVAGSVRVAVIGSCPVTATRLTDLVREIRSVTEVDALARKLSGCFHLVASIDGHLRIQGSLTGLRRVFHVRAGRGAIAGDRADQLAAIVDAGIDHDELAVRLVCGPQLPPPLIDRTCWSGVHALPGDHYLSIAPDGTSRETRWWRPPAAERSLESGADAVREALQAAVVARRPAGGRLSADLSGGMDSTSLCFLAAKTGAPDLLTFRWDDADEGNDDAVFAAEAARQLPEAEHLVVRRADLPTLFADPGASADPEAPYSCLRTLARTRHSAELLVSRGARTHLMGNGGDELFHSDHLGYVRSLLRRQPGTALAHLRGFRSLRRWTWPEIARALARDNSVRDWWLTQETALRTPVAARSPELGWGDPLRASPWVTDAAVAAARRVIRSAGERAEPLAADRGQHVDLATLRIAGPVYRPLVRQFALAGARLELPYLDDRVIESVLSVRPHERRTPWRYKPLLAEAMRDVVPAGIARRGTKGEFSQVVKAGLKANLRAVLAILADSELVRQGLVDSDLVKQYLTRPHSDSAAIIALENLLACENWIREVQPSKNKCGRV